VSSSVTVVAGVRVPFERASAIAAGESKAVGSRDVA
jgi:hypothetical protein